MRVMRRGFAKVDGIRLAKLTSKLENVRARLPTARRSFQRRMETVRRTPEGEIDMGRGGQRALYAMDFVHRLEKLEMRLALLVGLLHRRVRFGRGWAA